MTKSIATYYIDSKILESFEKHKGEFVKGQLVEFWIRNFLSKKEEYIPKNGDGQQVW